MGNCKSSSAMSPNQKIVVSPGDIQALLAEADKIRAQFPDNAMAQALSTDYVKSLTEEQQVRLLTCCMSGIKNPDSCMGCYAMNPKDYDEFRPFFAKAL
jgi:hypothetical protein